MWLENNLRNIYTQIWNSFKTKCAIFLWKTMLKNYPPPNIHIENRLSKIKNIMHKQVLPRSILSGMGKLWVNFLYNNSSNYKGHSNNIHVHLLSIYHVPGFEPKLQFMISCLWGSYYWYNTHFIDKDIET